MTTPEKIILLRSLMSECGFTAYIIPSSDPHQSEYLAGHWQTVQWLSGFTGSAGTIVVTKDFAGLWTDSRYFIQAEMELKESGIELVKLKQSHTPEYIDWLINNLRGGDVIGMDGKVFSESLVSTLNKNFSKKGININTVTDLIGQIWKERPQISVNSIAEHDLKYSGKSRQQKLEMVRNEMAKTGANFYLLTSLDDIAWLFNLRGSDIIYNPVFIAYAIVSLNDATIFVNEQKLPQNLKDKLSAESIKLESYENIDRYLTSLTPGSCLQYSSSKTSIYLSSCMPVHLIKNDVDSIVSRIKACKDKVELANIQNAMCKDGVAMVKFLNWVDDNIGKELITEVTLDEKITYFRSKQEGYRGNSFSTIAAYNDHGAIIHYNATPQSAYTLHPEGLLLFDSGGQYLDGTTDITRTIALGKPTDEQIRNYTLVLKGLIQLSMIIFPENTKGFQLDVLARKALWEDLINYGHGTGHGVGYYLNVHEGPQGITPNHAVNAPLELGMMQSVEPGCYKADEYGIRLENIILVAEHSQSEYGAFFRFETLTLCPFDNRLIEPDLLSVKEKDWLNSYHKKVFEHLSHGLTMDENQWLLEKTRAIGV